MPTVENVLRSMWERGWSFIKKAGTIILLSTIVLWFLMNFGWADGSFGMLEAEQLDSSILAAIGSVIAPIFAPLGWGNWKMAVAAITDCRLRFLSIQSSLCSLLRSDGCD